MNNAELYHQANGFQCRDAEIVIKEYVKMIRWRKTGGDRILDVGCGDGYVTMNVLAPKLPTNYKKLTGLDISAEMVKYATMLYGSPNVDFIVMDFSLRVPPEQKQKYDHVFSFNCLHWIQEQRTALKNIYDMLTTGGDCILTVGAKNPIYDVYRTLKASKKWSQYMNDLDSFISPYHDSACPPEDLKNLLYETGFSFVQVEYKKRTYYFEHLNVLKKSVFAVTPFIRKMPVELHDDFFNDYLDLVRSLDLMEGDNNNLGDNIKVKSPYYSLIAFARK